MIAHEYVKKFTTLPGARYRSDGAYSGQEFRETCLEPHIDAGVEILRVNLDGTSGYSTAFLEEAFGGLVRKYGLKRIEDMLILDSREEPQLLGEIREYMRDASTTRADMKIVNLLREILEKLDDIKEAIDAVDDAVTYG